MSASGSRFVVLPFLGAMALGLTGFLCGFFGPIVLSPEANQGPLLGIFIAGPLGAVTGLVLGLAAALLGMRPRSFGPVLAAACLAGAGATLYWSFPEPVSRGTIVDAEVRGCEAPDALVPAALVRWQEYADRQAAYSPVRAGWRDEVPGMLQADRGVVLSLLVRRRRRIEEQRRPWNRGQVTASRWTNEDKVEKFFARSDAASCEAVATGGRRFYAPAWEFGRKTPPELLPPFLSLYVLRDVPPEFAAFTADRP